MIEVKNYAHACQVTGEEPLITKEDVSGFGLSFSRCVSSRTLTCVGSRLMVGSIEEAKYIGSHPEALADYEAWNR